MYRLTPLSLEKYGAVRPLFIPLQSNLVVESVLDRYTLGRVYADDAANPRLAVLWTLTDTVLLAGEPDEIQFPDLRRLILEDMLPDARLDLVGIDLAYEITIQKTKWVSFFPKAKRVVNLLKEKVDQGHLGVKSGRGFYDYPDPAFEQPGFLTTPNPRVRPQPEVRTTVDTDG